MSTFFQDQQPVGRVVGTQNRQEIELDPLEAYRRGRVRDSRLRAVVPERSHGVTRGTHEYFNRIDEERQVLIARKLNTA